MKFLKQDAHDEVSITDMLMEALTTVEPARPVGNLHASALTHPKGFCPREVVLCKKLARKPYQQVVEAALTVTFHEGKDKQRRLNNDWLPSKMVGNWRCEHCGNLHEFQKEPYKCKICATKDLYYEEVVFHHPSGAQGSVDAIIDVGKPKLRLVEFKIMSHDEWEKLKAPLAEHRARSKLYLELVAESSHPQKSSIDTERMHVLYAIRGYGKKDAKGRINPFKEFIVHKSLEEVMPYLEMAKAVSLSRESEWSIVPEGICDSIVDKRCQKCSVAKECFGGKYPAALFWK